MTVAPGIPSMRAAHLSPYLDVLQAAGAPIERLLVRSKLPLLIDEIPDARIASRFWYNFVVDCERYAGIEGLGWLGAADFSLSQLHSGTASMIRQSPTVFERLALQLKRIELEAPRRLTGFSVRGPSVRIYCDPPANAPSPSAHVVDWLVLGGLINNARTLLGPSWAPREITLASSPPHLDAANRAFPNTRILTGQRHTSFLLPLNALTVPPERRHAATFIDPTTSSPSEMSNAELVASLQFLLQPYLGETAPSIELAADIAAMSVRTFQRRLAQAGTSYRRLLDVARYERAAELLRNPQHNIIDIAYAVGYTDPSNFARSFRRIGGLSPRAHRRVVEREAMPA